MIETSSKPPVAPERRWSYSLRTLFVVVMVASLMALTIVQEAKLGSLQSKVDALEMQNTAFREMLRTRPPLAIDSADPRQPRPATH
jgi:hypothetical protein